jgi:anti-sigma B factor antagonist
VPDLSIKVEDIAGHADAAVLRLTGSVDGSTLTAFQDALKDVAAAGKSRIVFDFERVRYINSAGLGALVTLANDVSTQAGAVVLAAVPAKVRVVVEMLGLHNSLPLFTDVEEGIRRLPTVHPDKGPVAIPAGATSASAAAAPQAEAKPAAAGVGKAICSWCSTPVRTRGAGTFRCSRCHSAVVVEAGGQARFAPRTESLPLNLSVDANPACAGAVGQFVETIARDAGFSEEDASALRSACEEVGRKIAAVCYNGDALKNYMVRIQRSPEEIVVRTSDYGETLTATDGQLEKLFPKAAALDALAWKAHPIKGNVITFSKKKG